MTLPSSNSQVVYTGNGLTTNFPFTFIVPTDSMQVSLYNTVTFTEDVLDPSVYTVNGYDAPAGGSVDYPLVGSPIAATLKLIITRVVPAVQELDLTGQSNWQPENLEEQLDLIVMMVQQLNTGLALAVTQSAATATGDPLTFNDVLEAAQAAATSASAAATSASGAAASAVTAAAQAAAAAASAATAAAAIAPITTRGDLLTRDAATPVRLAIGGANTFLGSDGTDPSWRTAAQVRTSLALVVGTNVQAFDDTLTALAAYNTNGLLTQTAVDTFVGRTLTGTASQLTVTNGNGVAGNPTVSLPAAITLPGTLTMGGLLDLAITGQVKFPAAQNASADANTLDDYEEGSTAPTPTPGGGAFTAVAAVQYTKVGRAVTFSAQISISNVGTGTGFISLPMPFAAAAVTAVSATDQTNGPGCSAYISGSNIIIVKYDGTTTIGVKTIVVGGVFNV